MTPQELKDAILEYGSSLTDEEYDVLYQFGLWYADKHGASDVVLSDWSQRMAGILD